MTKHHKIRRLLSGFLAVMMLCSVVGGLSISAAAKVSETDTTAESEAQKNVKNETARSIPFTDVTVNDEFWSAYQKMVICEAVFAGITNVERSGGGVGNIKNAAKKNAGISYGAHEGALYVDSDVHKLLEAMCYALQIDAAGDSEILAAQAKISAKMEEWIPYYQGAQEANGYFDTYFTLAYPNDKWTDFNKHELYCAGHFYEAAVAHYRMTNGTDTRLFDMAIKNADYVESLFGVGKWKQVPGHQEIELALLKLANLCREIGTKGGVNYAAKADKYVALAQFFLDTRGDHEGRHGTNLQPDMIQDELPLTEQTTALSHAVRAGYMYTAMVDATLQSGDTKYIDVLLALWDSVNTKTYATGGVGDTEHHEGYGEDYYMPIEKSYCETCAGVANLLWSQRMNLLFGDSEYADKMELLLYNAILPGINLDGNRFFYNNYVSSAGRERVEWYGTACCPPNLMRTLLSLGGYIYTQQGDQITMNLYVGNEANLSVSDGAFKLEVNSDYTWNGNAAVTFRADGARNMTLRLRVPDWAAGANTVKLNGEVISAVPDADGYITLSRTWNDGDTVTLDFAVEVQNIPMVEGVTYTENYTAFRRGPLVYCAEQIDNDSEPKSYYVSETAAFTETWADNIDGKTDKWNNRGMMKITTQDAKVHGLASDTDSSLTLIPYYANANRGATAMEVYFSLIPRDQNLEFYATPSASFTNGGNGTDSVLALNDGSTSSRWTSYDGSHVYSCPWVEYDFAQEVSVWGCEIMWYDDGGGVQVPNGLTIQYWDGAKFVDVSPSSPYIAFPKNSFATYSFAEVTTTKLRLVIDNTVSKRAPGIVEWKLLGSTEVPVRECVWDAESVKDGFDTACITTWDGHALGDFVDVSVSPDKGIDGSNPGAALAYTCLTDSDDGAHVLQINTAELPGFNKDWSDGEVFWYYVDASEYAGAVRLGMQLNWIDPAAGKDIYLWKGYGEPTVSKTFDAWDNHGRVQLPVGYKGFVGIPLSAYTTGGTLDKSDIHTIVAYYSPHGINGGVSPTSIYLDDFWVTAEGSTPAVSTEAPTVQKVVWDMEALPDNFNRDGVNTWGDGLSLGDYVDASVEVGKGVNSSVAFGYDYLNYVNSSLNGSFALQINTSMMAGFNSNWSDGEMLWYWIDASDFTNAFDLGIQLNWIDLEPGTPIQFWKGAGNPYSGGGAREIWDKHARVNIPAGYKGFVGVPLSGYVTGGVLDTSDIHTLVFYFDPKDTSDTYPKTLYLDHFCLTDMFSLPDIVVEGAEDEGKICKCVFDADAVAETFSTDTIKTHYNDSLSEGITNVFIESGMGFNGGSGLAYQFDGVWSTDKGDNNLHFTVPKAVGFDTDWGGADMLWFWIDNTDYREATYLRLFVDWCNPENGTLFYLWDGVGEKTLGGAMVDAWGGSAGWGKIPLPKNYKGFIGVPLISFKNLAPTDIYSIVLHIDATESDLANMPKTMWFDEFWVTAEDILPKVNVSACEHKNTEVIPAVPVTCVAGGYTEGVKCADCGEILTAPVEIAALGHDFVDGVCSRCGAEDPNYVPPTPVDPCEGYTDINRSSWYHSAADYVIKNGYMGSTKTDKLVFEPNTKVSRAMVASIMYRIAGSPDVEYKGSFTDVPSGKWFTAAIEWAAQNGLASGKGAGKFDPNGNVTRQELAVFMYKLSEHLGNDVTGRADLSEFADAASVPSWAKSFVEWAVAAGLISGKSNNGVTKLAPVDNATRAEFASIIMRFMSKPV